MATEIKIIRKEGWILNPDDSKVNGIFNTIGQNGGHCPTRTKTRIGHDQCPCADYLERDICHCGLYLKEPKINKDESKENNSKDI